MSVFIKLIYPASGVVDKSIICNTYSRLVDLRCHQDDQLIAKYGVVLSRLVYISMVRVIARFFEEKIAQVFHIWLGHQMIRYPQYRSVKRMN